MRLTLRTLLAWIDGLLEPADRTALGEKVGASSVAPVLVERIRGVVERGPLPAPEPTARGFAGDANTAAEYLDNVLPAERIEEFERVCIDSDLHLAEVAACHQLLADVARNPNLLDSLDDAGRRRLLDVLRQRVSDADAAAATVTTGTATRTVVRRPVPARPASAAAWLSAAAALLLLAGLGTALVWSLWKPSSRQVARNERPVAEQPAAAAEPPAAVDAAPPADGAAVAADVAVVDEPEPAVEEPRPPAETEPSDPPADAVVDAEPAGAMAGDAMESEVALDVAVPADTSVPQGDALAIAAPAPRPRPPLAAGGAAADAAPSRPPLPAPSSGTGVLLRRAADGGWTLHDGSAAIGPGEELVVPAACAAEIEIDGVIVRLLPATRALVSRDDDGLVRLTLESGRVAMLSRDPAARIGITAGGLAGVVETGLDRPLGVEVLGRRGGGRVGLAAGVFTTGPVVWRHVGTLAAAGATSDLPAGGGLVWDDVDPASARMLPAVEEPRWLVDTGISRVDRAAALVLAERLAADPPAEVLERMATDVRAEHRMAAAATLAVLGDYEPLARQLCSGEPRTALYEAQWAALEAVGVPLAIARGGDSAAAWDAALAAVAPAGTSEQLAAMSRGYDGAALMSGAAAELVTALDASDLAVRRFAFRALREALPDRDAASRYRPDRPPTLRRDGIAWWRGQLEQGRIGAGGTPDAPAP